MALLGIWTLALGLLQAGAADFTPLAPLPDSYRLHGLVHSDGFLYNLGGLSGSSGINGARKVFYARVESDGSIAAWNPGPDLPAIVFSHAVVAANKTLYVLGGQHFTPGAGVGPSDAVYFSRTNADGSPGAWSTTTPLPRAAFFLNAAFWNGRLYVTGGWNGAGLLPDVYSAAALPDGSLGPWRAETPLPEGVYTHAAAAEGTLYVLGGIVNGGADVRNDVYYAVVGVDGALGPWTLTSPLPTPLSNLGSVVSDGRVYVVGGFNGSERSSATYSAPILADRSLGEWTLYATMPAGRNQHGTASDGKRVYVSGGFGEVVLSDVLSVPLPEPQAPPPATTVPALVVFAPPVLNLSSNGRWVTSFLAFRRQLASAADVVPGSVAVTAVDGVAVAPIPADVKGNGGDEEESAPLLDVSVFKAKFDRVALAAVLRDGENRVTVTGRFADGRAFSGVGRIWGKERKPLVCRRAKNHAPPLKLADTAAQKPVDRDGGEVRAGRSGVRLPDGAVAAGVPVTVHEAPPQDDGEKRRQSSAASKKGLEAVGAPVEFGPHGTRFDKPVTLELPYERERLPRGVKESELAVHYWNAARGEWEALPSIVDSLARVVRAQTTHFSQYQVLSGGGALAAATGFGEVYAYPNPARGGINPVIHVEAPGADTVRVSIYDVTGARRHALTMTGAGAAHETTWDVSGIGSGVYYYVIEASGGGSTFRKSGKLAVIK